MLGIWHMLHYLLLKGRCYYLFIQVKKLKWRELIKFTQTERGRSLPFRSPCPMYHPLALRQKCWGMFYKERKGREKSLTIAWASEWEGTPIAEPTTAWFFHRVEAEHTSAVPAHTWSTSTHCCICDLTGSALRATLDMCVLYMYVLLCFRWMYMLELSKSIPV